MLFEWNFAIDEQKSNTICKLSNHRFIAGTLRYPGAVWGAWFQGGWIQLYQSATDWSPTAVRLDHGSEALSYSIEFTRYPGGLSNHGISWKRGTKRWFQVCQREITKHDSNQLYQDQASGLGDSCLSPINREGSHWRRQWISLWTWSTHSIFANAGKYCGWRVGAVELVPFNGDWECPSNEVKRFLVWASIGHICGFEATTVRSDMWASGNDIILAVQPRSWYMQARIEREKASWIQSYSTFVLSVHKALISRTKRCNLPCSLHHHHYSDCLVGSTERLYYCFVPRAEIFWITMESLKCGASSIHSSRVEEEVTNATNVISVTDFLAFARGLFSSSSKQRIKLFLKKLSQPAQQWTVISFFGRAQTIFGPLNPYVVFSSTLQARLMVPLLLISREGSSRRQEGLGRASLYLQSGTLQRSSLGRRA